MRWPSGAVCLSAGALALPRCGGAQSAGAIESALYEIRVGQLAPFVTTALVPAAGKLMLPCEPIFAAAGTTRDSATSAAIARAIADGSARRVESLTYLDAARVAQFLGAQIQIDGASLSVTLRRATLFPAEREALRSARAVSGARGDDGVAPLEAAWTPRSGGALFDWHIATSPNELNGGVYAEGRVGLAIFGGALTASGFHQTAPITSAGRAWGGSWSYDYVNPASWYVRHIRIGDLLGGAVTQQSLRGLEISNRPPFRAGYFADVDVLPTVPPGWGYELYQNGRLLGSVQPAGIDEPIHLPLTYGVTPVEVRAYGPAGEVTTMPLTFTTPPAQLPRGRIEYDVAAGRCEFGACRSLAYLTLDAGITNALTLGAGAEVWSDSLRHTATPIARVSYASQNGWLLQADYQPAVLERVLASFAGQRVSGSAQAGESYSEIDPLSARTLGTVTTTAAQWFGTGSIAAHTGIDGAPEWWPRGSIVTAWVNGDSTHVTGWEVGVEEVLRGVSVGARYSRADQSLGGVTSFSATVVQPGTRRLWQYVPVVTVGAGGGADTRFVEGGATIELASHGTISLSGHVAQPGRGASYFTLDYTALLGVARVGTQVRGSANAPVSTLLELSGAVAVDAQRAVLIDPTISDNSAGVRGLAYYDDNDDGIYDAGDRPAEGVRVFIGGHLAVADANGRFRSWNVLPYQAVTVDVDSLEGIDPAYSPYPAPPMRATPNMFNPVVVRLARVTEVAGRVEIDGEPAPGGIRLVLDNGNPRFRSETLTYADGSYAFERVFAGRYDVYVAPAALAALGVRGSSTSVDVHPAASDAPVSGPTISLRAAPIPHGSTPSGEPSPP